jgi:hypothetical protein
MKRTFCFISLILGLLFITPVYSLGKPITGASPYLRLNIGAKAHGFGGAFVAVANDATSTHWNPAGLVRLRNIQFLTMCMVNKEFGRNLNYFTLALPFSKFGFGVSWLSSGIKDIQGYNKKDEPTGVFNNKEDALIFSYAHRISDLSLGINFKYITHTLNQKKANGFSSDVGILYRPIENLSFGVVLQSIFGQKMWSTHTESIPLNLRIGVAAKPLDGMICAFEVEGLFQQNLFKYHLGCEYWVMRCLALRSGVDNGSLTFGIGIRFKALFGTKVQFDYVFDSESLNEIKLPLHQVSMGMIF